MAFEDIEKTRVRICLRCGQKLAPGDEHLAGEGRIKCWIVMDITKQIHEAARKLLEDDVP